MCVDIISCCFMFNIICIHVTKHLWIWAEGGERWRDPILKALIKLGGKVFSCLLKQIKRFMSQHSQKAQQKRKLHPALFYVPSSCCCRSYAHKKGPTRRIRLAKVFEKCFRCEINSSSWKKRKKGKQIALWTRNISSTMLNFRTERLNTTEKKPRWGETVNEANLKTRKRFFLKLESLLSTSDLKAHLEKNFRLTSVSEGSSSDYALRPSFAHNFHQNSSSRFPTDFHWRIFMSFLRRERAGSAGIAF